MQEKYVQRFKAGARTETSERTWNQGNKYLNTKRHEGLHRLLEILHPVSLRVSVPTSSSSWLCSLRLFLDFFFFFLYPRMKRERKEHLHTWVNRGCRCVGGELWESNRVSFSPSLSTRLTLSLLRCFHTASCLYWKICVCAQRAGVRLCPLCALHQLWAPNALGSWPLF